MNRLLPDRRLGALGRAFVVLAAIASSAAMPPISEQARRALDRNLGAKGVYVAEESAYKFVFPRADVSVRVGGNSCRRAKLPTPGRPSNPQ